MRGSHRLPATTRLQRRIIARMNLVGHRIFYNFLLRQNTPRDATGPGALTVKSRLRCHESGALVTASMNVWISFMRFIVLRILYTSITDAAFALMVRSNGSGSADLIRWREGLGRCCYRNAQAHLRVSPPFMNFLK
jgi:hypothetical protein